MNTIFEALFITLQLCLSLFGLLIVVGFILSVLHKKIQQIYHSTFGWYGILWTAWIGTPIHELSHLFFIQLFRHKVTHISLFAPNQQTGGLGSVDHSYNPRNIYHQIGNFFIGMAPLIIGSVILAAIIFSGFARGPEIINRIYSSYNASAGNYTPTTVFVDGMYSISDMVDVVTPRPWHEYLVLYLVITISSHIVPSRKDIINALRGLPFICGALFLIAIILSIFSISITPLTQGIQLFTTALAQLQLFIGLLLLFHLAIISIITLPIRAFRARRA